MLADSVVKAHATLPKPRGELAVHMCSQCPGIGSHDISQCFSEGRVCTMCNCAQLPVFHYFWPPIATCFLMARCSGSGT